MAQIIETEFELNEEVFVPAGDGEPAQTKRKGDMLVGEFHRYAARQAAEAAAFQAEVDLEVAWIKEADRRRVRRDLGEDTPMRELLTAEEWEEFRAINAKTRARRVAAERREAAIERDIAAGRYRTFTIEE